jgi:hypothetical protein
VPRAWRSCSLPDRNGLRPRCARTRSRSPIRRHLRGERPACQSDPLIVHVTSLDAAAPPRRRHSRRRLASLPRGFLARSVDDGSEEIRVRT